MRLNLLVIKTHQVDALAAFYSYLGFDFDYHQHGKGPWHYAAELDGFVFEIYPLSKTKPVDNSLRLGFVIKNLDGLVSQLQQEQVIILKMPQQTTWGYQALIKDLDGRIIELTEALA